MPDRSPAVSTDPIAVKADVLRYLREVLHAEGFTEAVTPVARRADLGPGRRAGTDLAGGRFLRAMIGPALRVNISARHPRLYEIGPCFRPEASDALHAAEFSMLDLYAAGLDFDGLTELARRLVAPYLPGAWQRVSVADHLHEVFGIDLRRQQLGDLPRLMSARMDTAPDTPFKDVLGRYIGQVLEADSIGKAVLLTDYPVGGDEPCARLAPGTRAVLERFELIVDGIEVIHGYTDETDRDAFLARADAVGLLDDEQRLAWAAIDEGRVPADTGGLGIGIERLCAVAAGARDIRPFQQSPQF